jgi:hypothetical protein
MHCRRLTRLTNAFSKKFENFEAAVSLNFTYYNFVKTHGAIRMTPAWRLTLKRLIGRLNNSLKTVANKNYIERLKQVIFHLHKSGATHVGSVPVEEIFGGKTLWKGDVEVFDLTGHRRPNAAMAGRMASRKNLLPSWNCRPSPTHRARSRLAFHIKSKRRGENESEGFQKTPLPYFCNNAHAHHKIGASPCGSPTARGRSR